MKQLFHDGMARFTLYRTTRFIREGSCTCKWCGCIRKTKLGKAYLYEYHTQADDALHGNRSYIPGLFCSRNCQRCYNGE